MSRFIIPVLCLTLAMIAQFPAAAEENEPRIAPLP